MFKKIFLIILIEFFLFCNLSLQDGFGIAPESGMSEESLNKKLLKIQFNKVKESIMIYKNKWYKNKLCENNITETEKELDKKTAKNYWDRFIIESEFSEIKNVKKTVLLNELVKQGCLENVEKNKYKVLKNKLKSLECFYKYYINEIKNFLKNNLNNSIIESEFLEIKNVDKTVLLNELVKQGCLENVEKNKYKVLKSELKSLACINVNCYLDEINKVKEILQKRVISIENKYEIFDQLIYGLIDSGVYNFTGKYVLFKKDNSKVIKTASLFDELIKGINDIHNYIILPEVQKNNSTKIQILNFNNENNEKNLCFYFIDYIKNIYIKDDITIIDFNYVQGEESEAKTLFYKEIYFDKDDKEEHQISYQLKIEEEDEILFLKEYDSSNENKNKIKENINNVSMGFIKKFIKEEFNNGINNEKKFNEQFDNKKRTILKKIKFVFDNLSAIENKKEILDLETNDKKEKIINILVELIKNKDSTIQVQALDALDSVFNNLIDNDKKQILNLKIKKETLLSILEKRLNIAEKKSNSTDKVIKGINKAIVDKVKTLLGGHIKYDITFIKSANIYTNSNFNKLSDIKKICYSLFLITSLIIISSIIFTILILSSQLAFLVWIPLLFFSISLIVFILDIIFFHVLKKKISKEQAIVIKLDESLESLSKNIDPKLLSDNLLINKLLDLIKNGNSFKIQKNSLVILSLLFNNIKNINEKNNFLINNKEIKYLEKLREILLNENIDTRLKLLISKFIFENINDENKKELFSINDNKEKCLIVKYKKLQEQEWKIQENSIIYFCLDKFSEVNASDKELKEIRAEFFNFLNEMYIQNNLLKLKDQKVKFFLDYLIDFYNENKHSEDNDIKAFTSNFLNVLNSIEKKENLFALDGDGKIFLKDFIDVNESKINIKEKNKSKIHKLYKFKSICSTIILITIPFIITPIILLLIFFSKISSLFFIPLAISGISIIIFIPTVITFFIVNYILKKQEDLKEKEMENKEKEQNNKESEVIIKKIEPKKEKKTEVIIIKEKENTNQKQIQIQDKKQEIIKNISSLIKNKENFIENLNEFNDEDKEEILNLKIKNKKVIDILINKIKKQKIKNINDLLILESICKFNDKTSDNLLISKLLDLINNKNKKYSLKIQNKSLEILSLIFNKYENIKEKSRLLEEPLLKNKKVIVLKELRKILLDENINNEFKINILNFIFANTNNQELVSKSFSSKEENILNVKYNIIKDKKIETVEKTVATFLIDNFINNKDVNPKFKEEAEKCFINMYSNCNLDLNYIYKSSEENFGGIKRIIDFLVSKDFIKKLLDKDIKFLPKLIANNNEENYYKDKIIREKIINVLILNLKNEKDEIKKIESGDLIKFLNNLLEDFFEKLEEYDKLSCEKEEVKKCKKEVKEEFKKEVEKHKKENKEEIKKIFKFLEVSKKDFKKQRKDAFKESSVVKDYKEEMKELKEKNKTLEEEIKNLEDLIKNNILTQDLITEVLCSKLGKEQDIKCPIDLLSYLLNFIDMSGESDNNETIKTFKTNSKTLTINRKTFNSMSNTLKNKEKQNDNNKYRKELFAKIFTKTFKLNKENEILESLMSLKDLDNMFDILNLIFQDLKEIKKIKALLDFKFNIKEKETKLIEHIVGLNKYKNVLNRIYNNILSAYSNLESQTITVKEKEKSETKKINIDKLLFKVLWFSSKTENYKYKILNIINNLENNELQDFIFYLKSEEFITNKELLTDKKLLIEKINIEKLKESINKLVLALEEINKSEEINKLEGVNKDEKILEKLNNLENNIELVMSNA